MMVNTVFGIVAGLLMAFSKVAASYEMIIIGRFLVGFNSGQRLTSHTLHQVSASHHAPSIRSAPHITRLASGQRFTSHT